jgi:hypothetical protein
VSDLNDALLYFDLDKGPDAPGPLFEEPRRLIEGDPRLRAGWFQFQALRALALEMNPEPGERMLRAVLMQCRRERVGRQLAQATGTEDEARAILLGRVPEGRSFPAWILGLLLVGALGLGWMAFRENWLGTPAGDAAAGSAPNAPSAAVNGENLPFEFPVRTPPADAALSAPADESGPAASDADDTHTEVPAARQARMILREHLHEAQARVEAEQAAADGAAPAPSQAAAMAAPAFTSAPLPTALSTPVPTAVVRPKARSRAYARRSRVRRSVPVVRPMATPVPQVQATSVPVQAAAPTQTPPQPGLSPTSGPSGAQTSAAAPLSPSAEILDIPAGLTLSSRTLTRDNASLDIGVGFPERRDIDIRLFDGTGRSVRVLAAGAFGPGAQHFPMDARNDGGQTLAPGTYYLRVMTPWFVRVEPIQIQ